MVQDMGQKDFKLSLEDIRLICDAFLGINDMEQSRIF